MSDALIGYGTQYWIKDNELDPPAFVQVAEVTNVTPGEAKADRKEATHYESPGRRREYISGLIDNGEATVDLNWVPGGPTDLLLRRLFASGEVTDHKIVFPGATPRKSVIFDASITGFTKAIPIDDRMTAKITVAVSGDETWGTEA